MDTRTIKFHGINLILSGFADGHQFDVHGIELEDESQLTELLLDMDKDCDIERLAAENAPEIDEDAIYESLNDK